MNLNTETKTKQTHYKIELQNKHITRLNFRNKHITRLNSKIEEDTSLPLFERKTEFMRKMMNVKPGIQPEVTKTRGKYNLLYGSWSSHKKLSTVPNGSSSMWNCYISQVSILRPKRRYDNVMLVCKSTIFNSLVPCSPFWLGQKPANRLKSFPAARDTSARVNKRGK